MKKYLFVLFSVFTILYHAQKREMADNFSKGNFEKAIEIGKAILKTTPDDMDAILIIARSENEKNNFESALPYLDKAKSLMKEDYQKSWTLLESAKSNFGSGNLINSNVDYKEALKANGTKNSVKVLNRFGMISGLDEFYKNWKTVESRNITFHFEKNITEQEISRIVKTRQQAFDQINLFFNSKLPKKIDFFVWNQKDAFNPVLNKNLGFSEPALCVAHNRLNQSPGHEIAHNISFWKSKNNIRTQFINEGIGVCFDQQSDDKMSLAKAAFKKSPFDIREIWKGNSTVSEDVLYPVAGAFVEYLVKTDKNQFLKLSENQTYENAEKIYNKKIDQMIENFIEKLNE